MRIKGLQVVPRAAIHPDRTNEENLSPFVVSASSDGSVKVWDSSIFEKGDENEEQQIECICSVQTKDRTTALAVSYPFNLSGIKRSLEDESDDESSEEPNDTEEQAVKAKETKKTNRKRKAKKPKVNVTFE